MIPGFKHMLADDAPADLSQLRYPGLLSPKLDGVRAVIMGGVVYSRNLKPLPNKLLQKKFGRKELEGFDGELVVGDPRDPQAFSRTQSVTKRDGALVDDLMLHAFDRYRANLGFLDRLEQVCDFVDRHGERADVCAVPHTYIGIQTLLEEMEDRYVLDGFEGVMWRDPQGLYKFGRSTAREGGLLKVKRFAHDEAELLDYFEQMENTNEQTTDELGRSKRSSKKAGKVGKGILGGFRVRMLTGTFKGVELDVGTGNGWTGEWRAWAWVDLQKRGLKAFVAKHGHLRVKHQLAGAKDAPRFPIGDGWREPGQ